MKVAIAATDVHTSSQIHRTFGMAPYFLIFDSITGHVTPIPNPMQTSGVSTGVEVARILVEHQIQEVVAGMFGDRVRNVFSTAGIRTRVVEDSTVEKVIQSYQGANATISGNQSQLLPSARATVLQVPRNACYCSSCGYSTAEEVGDPCFQQYCPNCKTPLERKY